MAPKKHPIAQPTWQEPFAREREALRRQWKKLMEKHKGEFVAIYQGRVVGHGLDDEELASQLFRTLGDVPFYIARLEKEPTVYDLPAPEVAP